MLTKLQCIMYKMIGLLLEHKHAQNFMWLSTMWLFRSKTKKK